MNRDEQLDTAKAIALAVRHHNGDAYFVGGYVRDKLMNKYHGYSLDDDLDIDIEGYGIPENKLKDILENIPGVNVDLVGESFKVFKVKNCNIDVSLPRIEYKTASKSSNPHKDFTIESSHLMSYHEASMRRDLTINSILEDILTGKIIDSYHGVDDIKNKVLKQTSSKFSEDPLRVLRVMQFTSRFPNFIIHSNLMDECRGLSWKGLSNERVFDEIKKLILQGIKPSKGLQFLVDCGWIGMFPELDNLRGCLQDANHHPEGDVWVHTLHCMDIFTSLIRDARNWDKSISQDTILYIGLGVLLHDVGKPSTTEVYEDGKITSYGHDVEGVILGKQFLDRLTTEHQIFDEVLPLISYHMQPTFLFNKGKSPSSKSIKKLMRRCNLPNLLDVVFCDLMGRPPLSQSIDVSYLLELRNRYDELKDITPMNQHQAIMQGRHLIMMGYKPSPIFGEILAKCLEAEIDGVIVDVESGKQFVKENYK